MPEDPDLRPLWAFVERQFALGPFTAHGPDHWRRVERNGLEVARQSGANVRVVRLFAVLHDARRVNEGSDTGHGRRAAYLAQQVRGDLFELDDEGFAKLYDACAAHELGQTSADPTIGTCWDADRLDLARVGARPMAEYMSTAYGKHLAAGGPPRL